MSKDSEKHARQNFATKHKDCRTNIFKLEGYNSGDNPDKWKLNDAIAMSARNKSKMVGNGRVYGMATPTRI